MDDLTDNSKQNGLVLSISESSNDKVQVRISDGGLQKRISKRKKQLQKQLAQIEEFVLAVDRLDAQVENITRRRSNRLKSIGESEAVSDVNTQNEVSSLQTFTSDEDTSVSLLKGGKVLDMNDSSHGSTNATATTTSQSSDSVSSSSESLEAKHINTDANTRKEEAKIKNVKPMLYIRKESLEHQISSLELEDATKKTNELKPRRCRTRTCSTVSSSASSSNGGDSLADKEEDTNRRILLNIGKIWVGWLDLRTDNQE